MASKFAEMKLGNIGMLVRGIVDKGFLVDVQLGMGCRRKSGACVAMHGEAIALWSRFYIQYTMF